MHNITPVILNMNDEYWLQYSLKSLSGHFDRYVIYDVGSTDRSKDIIEWFAAEERKRAEVFVRLLPFVPPVVQGTFRNSMIAEANAKNYFIVDADEIYTEESLRLIKLYAAYPPFGDERPYGLVRRVEVVEGLDKAYGVHNKLPHHRLYSRNAYWAGNHPGEVAVIPQNRDTEYWIEGATCYHFHNTYRSSKDAEVPKRIERRRQATYHRGDLSSLEVVKILPILLNKYEDFPVNPSLKVIHDAT